ncbi:MAG: hypothetical protein CTY34_13000 [Methylobacter sp.]|nr:MAG: hypothetical protein CTY34_13000 [Methylobacter sp.]PPD04637.1 MAG: hypothetical protein CTY29_04665 [Methylobacter sp.]PPD19140.1 MAG: hypothetical protein CTY24_11655 [Methylobacter sp.]PPD37466.1 MAG: hypothetical protein CTY18_00630 [Methylomonas sp.]
MKIKLSNLSFFALTLLTACTTIAPVQETAKPSLIEESVQPLEPDVSSSEQIPPPTWKRQDKTLRLVRVMDGGVCKNGLQGARGAFLLYAEPSDVERIKNEQGTKVFLGFEKQIEAFAAQALEYAVNVMTFEEDPFSLGEDVSQQRLIEQLNRQFRIAVEPALTKFTSETTLLVDIVPFVPSFDFLQKGCDASRLQAVE